MEQENKLKGVGLLAFISLILAIVTSYAVLLGSAFTGHLIWYITLIPIFFLLGSIGLFARRKWSLFFIVPVSLITYYLWTTNGGQTGWFDRSGLIRSTFINPQLTIFQKIPVFIILIIPFAILFYLIKNYSKLR